MSLEQTFAQMHELLRGRLDPKVLAEQWAVSETRLLAYQNFVQGHVMHVMRKIYTALPAVLGETYETTAKQYFQNHPPQDYELNHASEGYYSFLASLADKDQDSRLQFAAELAELEWHEFSTYASPVDVPDSVDIPVLNPTLEILQPQFDVATWLKNYRKNKKNDVPPKEPNVVVFVFRSPKNHYGRFIRADDRALFAFKMLHDGLSIDDAVGVSGLASADVKAILQDGQNAGFVLLPETFL